MENSHLGKVEKTDEFISLVRGRIIGAAIIIEREIDYLLVSYFKPKHEIFFYEVILLELSWDKKITLVDKIIKNESIIDRKKIVNRTREIKTRRNSAAHWLPLYNYKEKEESFELLENDVDFFRSGKKTYNVNDDEIVKFEIECNEIAVEIKDLNLMLQKKQFVKS